MNHQTVAYASHQGSSKGNTSSLDDKAAPISALFTAASGMLNQETLDQAGSDAQSKNTSTTNDKLPHTTDPIIALSAKAGLGAVAGQNLQLANGETVSLMSGQDSQFITGNQLRVHTGQAIGLLAGAVKPGDSNLGLQFIAAQQAIDIQAQSDEIKIQAKDMINIMSANAHIDWAAAKSISLSTAGGANITIEGGNITTQCPGNLTIHASQKSFTGATSMSYAMPALPRGPMPVPEHELLFDLRLSDSPGPFSHPLSFTPWKIVVSRYKPEGMGLIEDKYMIASGVSDIQGRIALNHEQQKNVANSYCLNPSETWLMYPGQAVQISTSTENSSWTKDEKLFQSMSASDFSASVYSHRYSDSLSEEIQLAKKAVEAEGEIALVSKLKS